MSMYFFCIYNNDLLNELVSIACPISIAHKILTCPAFADDIAVAAKSESTLHIQLMRLLNTVLNGDILSIGTKFEYLFSVKITECVLLISQ